MDYMYTKYILEYDWSKSKQMDDYRTVRLGQDVSQITRYAWHLDKINS